MPTTVPNRVAISAVKAFMQYKNMLKDIRTDFALTPEYVVEDTPFLELPDGLVYAVSEGPSTEQRKPLIGISVSTSYDKRKLIGIRTVTSPETISKEQTLLLEAFWLTRPRNDELIKAWSSIDDVWNYSRNEEKAAGVPDDQIHNKSSKEVIDIFAPKERYVHLPWIPSKRFALPVIVMFAYRRKRDKADVDMVPSMWFAKDYKTKMLTAAGHTAVIKPMSDFKSGKLEAPSVMYTYEQATEAWNKHIVEITRGYFDDSDLSLSHEAISTVYLGMSAIIPPEYFAWYTQYHKDFFDYLFRQLNKEDKVD